MKRLVATVKAALLLGSVLLMAWSIGPGASTASASTYCKNSGDTCAVIILDKTSWYKELE